MLENIKIEFPSQKTNYIFLSFILWTDLIYSAFRKRNFENMEIESKIREKWQEYKVTGNIELRNELVEIYLPLVGFIAERVCGRLPKSVDINDLKSAGIFGLIDAVENFDLKRGIKFETYAPTRIRGAILDGLRKIDWVPKVIRNKANRLKNMEEILETELGYKPAGWEVAERLGIPVNEYEKLKHLTEIISLEQLQDHGPYSGRRDVSLEDKRTRDPRETMARTDSWQFITRLLEESLEETDYKIFIEYMLTDKTLVEIRKEFDMSKSYIWWRYERAQKSLSERFRNRKEMLVSELV